MSRPPTIDQLRNLADRAARGPLTPDEIARLRDGINQLEHAEAELRDWAERDSMDAAAGSYAGRAEAVEARVKAALDLHQSMERGPFTICAHCSGWDGRRCLGVVTEYPCPTVTALTEETPVSDDNCVTDVDPAPPTAPTEAEQIAEQAHTLQTIVNRVREAVATDEPAWTPPPPGDRREQLPDSMLDLIRDRMPDYLSTACQTADTLACAACHPGAGVPRPQYDEIREHAERLHNRCRINQKFTGQLCACGCH